MKELKRLFSLLRPWAGWILLGIFLSLITMLANVALMAVSGWFIAAMAVAGLAGTTINYFTPAAVIRAMAITRTVGRYAERLVTHEATLRLVAHLRRWFYDRLEPLAPAGLAGSRAGDLFSRIGADITVLENFYLRVVVPVAVALLALPIFLVFFGYFSPLLALVMAGLYGLVALLLPMAVLKWGKAASARKVTRSATLRAHLVEGQQGLRELLVYGRAHDHEAKSDAFSEALSVDQKRLASLQAISQGSIGLASNLAVWMVLILIIPLVGAGQFEGPILPMLCLFAMASFEAILPLPVAVEAYITTRTAAGRLFALADREPVTQSAEASPAAKMSSIAGPVDLAFEHVRFAYQSMEKPLFEDLSFALKAGNRLALVGPSGSGKSSIINMLMGFWPIESGSIRFGGTNITQLEAETLRSHVSVAPQQVHLFNTTIRANLLLANKDASDDTLMEALELVDLADFIKAQPEGLGTFVGEAGTALSGGQIRRLALARALLRPAPILILDEPGEGLDRTREEAVLDRILDHAARQDRPMSVILITHSSVGLERMDQIIRFDHRL